MLSKIKVSPAPHVSKAHSTQSIMLDVLIGLSPALIAAIVYFRLAAVTMIITCVASCMATEYACSMVRKKGNSLCDLSAVVTGVIIAMSLSPLTPVWAAAIGCVFAIAIGKMVFGGLGSNTFNPAMVGRVFIAVSFGTLAATWAVPATIDSANPQINVENTATANQELTPITQATPLAWSKQAIKGESKVTVANSLIKSNLLGQTGGCLGETSAIALIIGGIYLLIKRTISFYIPAAVLLSAFAVASIFWLTGSDKYASPIFHLTSGGMLLCAFFIATDPVTAPLTKKGMCIFGIGIGVLIMLIRLLGEYPEGIMYAVLLMNALTPLIDRFVKLTPAGGKVNAGQ